MSMDGEKTLKFGPYALALISKSTDIIFWSRPNLNKRLMSYVLSCKLDQTENSVRISKSLQTIIDVGYRSGWQTRRRLFNGSYSYGKAYHSSSTNETFPLVPSCSLGPQERHGPQTQVNGRWPLVKDLKARYPWRAYSNLNVRSQSISSAPAQCNLISWSFHHAAFSKHGVHLMYRLLYGVVDSIWNISM